MLGPGNWRSSRWVLLNHEGKGSCDYVKRFYTAYYFKTASRTQPNSSVKKSMVENWCLNKQIKSTNGLD